MLKGRNITGIIVSITYCLVLYEILLRAPEGESPNHPLWHYMMIPIGAIVICFIFDHIIKFDFFKNAKDSNEK